MVSPPHTTDVPEDLLIEGINFVVCLGGCGLGAHVYECHILQYSESPSSINYSVPTDYFFPQFVCIIQQNTIKFIDLVKMEIFCG